MSQAVQNQSNPYKIEILYGLSEALGYIMKQGLDKQINASLADCFNTLFNLTNYTFTDTMAQIAKQSKDNNDNYVSVIISSATTPFELLSFGQLKLKNSDTDNNPYIVNLCTPKNHREGGWAQIVVYWLEYIITTLGGKSLYLKPETPKLFQYYTKLGYKAHDNQTMVKHFK